MSRKITDEERFKTEAEFLSLQSKNPLSEDDLYLCKMNAFAKGKNFDYNFQKEVIRFHGIGLKVSMDMLNEIYDICNKYKKEDCLGMVLKRTGFNNIEEVMEEIQ